MDNKANKTSNKTKPMDNQHSFGIEKTKVFPDKNMYVQDNWRYKYCRTPIFLILQWAYHGDMETEPWGVKQFHIIRHIKLRGHLN